MITIIIGLGNPGEKYKNTRHNVGFMVLDKFAEKNNFPEFKLSKKYDAEISSAFAEASADKEGNEILLVKPQTFMNDSGKSVSKLISNFKFQISNFIVVHDDIDLPVGKIKIVKDRGSAGHKGVESIIQKIGNDNLIRLRIGISGPASAEASAGKTKKIKAMKVVLKKFTKEEQKTIAEVVSKTADAIDSLIKNGLEKAMNEYNK